ncbi:MAG: rhodanese-like domain-containing protein [Acidobacteria bacterium]|nr:MAG: rhodanese-like domain-containing protein [Acidobacteriota bacterium]
MPQAAISPEALNERIAAGRAPVILDVRSKREYDAGHVPGAIHIPFWQIGGRWRELAGVRGQPVAIYCGHGPRAHIAGAMLARHGFTAIAYLTGHMKRWKALNLPIEVHR